MKEKLKIIENAWCATSPEDTAPVMSECLMDTDWSTYKMFENLCSEYLQPERTDEFREGIDTALRILIGKDLEGLAKEILSVNN